MWLSVEQAAEEIDDPLEEIKDPLEKGGRLLRAGVIPPARRPAPRRPARTAQAPASYRQS